MLKNVDLRKIFITSSPKLSQNREEQFPGKEFQNLRVATGTGILNHTTF